VPGEEKQAPSPGTLTPVRLTQILASTIATRLAAAGCIAPSEEALELVAAAADLAHLEKLVIRREQGEPLAWITGCTRFLGQTILLRRGVYVPRPQTEDLARRAVNLLPELGTAADLCTGSGAIAAVLKASRPNVRVVASDLDTTACECARSNGVEVYLGDLAEPLPKELRGHLDLVVAVPPYVPTGALRFLPTDARDHEPIRALDGGPGGIDVLVPTVRAAAELLRPHGALLLELGGNQDEALADVLARSGFDYPARLTDAEGDLRGIETTLLSH
jgi:release factor glutamine methyltransferase